MWVACRREILVDGNVATGTGDRVLVEASPLDRVWGTSLAADEPRTPNPRGRRGLNLLGFALADVRAQLGSRSGSPAAR
ncbi:MAG: hypothetical protein QOI78_7392 [Actinomycetota bacterium]|jgi:predicted NAD-dependent protein-ADP-ribosyltransferase YbiA (DUF1768 family)|nr:hypothetical protein [Actinomycetota bacterium]